MDTLARRARRKSALQRPAPRNLGSTLRGSALRRRARAHDPPLEAPAQSLEGRRHVALRKWLFGL